MQRRMLPYAKPSLLRLQTIKMSGNPNVSGMLNKLQGCLEKAATICGELVTTIDERNEAEKLDFPQSKKMSDKIGTGVKKGKQ